MNGITIRPMTLADLDWVMTLEAASFPSPWSREHFVGEICSPVAFPLVAAMDDGEHAGYICPTLIIDEGEIRNVAVRPDMRGRGIGRLLVETVIEQFAAMGTAFVSLEVRPSNRVALELYESCGFKAVGRRRNYYENGEDALVMEYVFTFHKEDSHAV